MKLLITEGDTYKLDRLYSRVLTAIRNVRKKRKEKVGSDQVYHNLSYPLAAESLALRSIDVLFLGSLREKQNLVKSVSPTKLADWMISEEASKFILPTVIFIHTEDGRMASQIESRVLRLPRITAVIKTPYREFMDLRYTEDLFSTVLNFDSQEIPA